MKIIAVNTVKAFLKENQNTEAYTKEYHVGDAVFHVTIQTHLSIDEKSTFINRVLSGCFDVTGNFRPEYVTPMLRATVIQMCTNIPAMTLKNETDVNGAPVLDLDGMNDLYVAMDLDHVPDESYQTMLRNMTDLCGAAIDWKLKVMLANHDTDSALRGLLTVLTEKVKETDVENLVRYAGTLAENTKNLDEDGILKWLIALHEQGGDAAFSAE